VVKYGLIRDRAFFDWLEVNVGALLSREPEALGHAVETSCRHKAQVVARDETEQGERALLNFGHTFGHAIEAGLGYGKWLHGEAVAAGIALAADLSQRMGMLGRAELERVLALLERAGLPAGVKGFAAPRLLELMSIDKKAREGR